MLCRRKDQLDAGALERSAISRRARRAENLVEGWPANPGDRLAGIAAPKIRISSCILRFATRSRRTFSSVSSAANGREFAQPSTGARAPRPPSPAPRARHRPSKRRQCSIERRVAGIAGGDQHIADEAVAADALDRRAGEEGPEGRHRRAPAVRRAAAPSDRPAPASFISRAAPANLFHGQAARQSSQP